MQLFLAELYKWHVCIISGYYKGIKTISLFHDGYCGKLFTGFALLNPPRNPTLQDFAYGTSRKIKYVTCQNQHNLEM